MHLAFRRIPAEDDNKPVAILRIPGVTSHWSGGLTSSRNVEQMQSKAVFSLAAETTGYWNPTWVERAVAGSSYSSLERKRFFERLAKGEYRVVAGLARQEPNLTYFFRQLEERGGDVEGLLNWPLWELLDCRLDLWELQKMSDEVEAFCDYCVPAPPRPDVFDIARYVEELFPFEFDEHCRMLNMAILCLNRAASTLNLAQYIITYEALFNAYLRAPFDDCCIWEVVWIETLSHVNRWYRTLELYTSWVETGPNMLDKCMHLRDYGIDFKVSYPEWKMLRAEVVYPTPFAEKFSAIRLPDSIERIKEYM